VLFQDAVWVLPNAARTLEQFQWLAAEIVEMSGEATEQAHALDWLRLAALGSPAGDAHR
jgi:hypothetical protein